MSKVRKQMSKAMAYLKKNGIKKTCIRTARKIHLMKGVDYEKWLKKHSPSQEALNIQRRENTGVKPVVAVHLFSDDDTKIEEVKAYVSMQTYGFLAIGEVGCHADLHLYIRNGVHLTENAVYEMVRVMKEDESVDLLYADDDVERFGRFSDPFFKPEYDEVLFWQWNYLGDVLLVRNEVADKVAGATDFDEIIASANVIKRIPMILSHTDGSYRKVRKLVDRQNVSQPLISVIIPNRDHGQDLTACVDSLIEKGGYANIEVLIVENHSTDSATFICYDRLREKYPFVRIISWEQEFNYALINNYAAAVADGEYLLFLNNDTRVKKEGFLRELMKWGSLKKCGAVGARLLYADETIQHGGVVLGYGGIAGHAFEGLTPNEYEDTVYAHVVRQMSAVTAACMLVKKQAFQEIGGFFEELKVAYNDIDFCLNLIRHGWQVLYDPFAVMYHLESQTRGLELTKEKAARVMRESELFCQRWQEEIQMGDRFYNPNLTLEKADFSLKR